jgi:PTS system nitrogen regulatory IIA component
MDPTMPMAVSRNVTRAIGPAFSLRRIASWLQPQEILLDVDLRNRQRAVETAAAALARRHGLDAGLVLRALWRREQIGSTALGCGIAIPHARVGGIEHPVTLFMRGREPIDFDAPDGKLVGCILTILVPAEGDTDDHLQMLALIARMFSDRAFRTHIASAVTVAEVQSAFSDCIQRVA